MVWVKDKIGMGYYARQRHELVAIATRGTPGVPAPSRRPDSVIEAARGEHSTKPSLHDLLDHMWPGVPKVELFARTPIDREWWSTWGNDEALT
jgi:N6-adenosine-specific RNA methylase IME4